MMQNNEHHRFFACICYSLKDAAFAKRLYNYLNRFKLPVRLSIDHPNTPKRLCPVCDWLNEFQPRRINNQDPRPDFVLSSKFLIVVCSINLTHGDDEDCARVNAEVKRFLEADERNKERVIPVLLREPGGPSSRECTPEAIARLELLAADVADKGEERAFNDVAAKMLELAPNALWNWWERIQKRRRTTKLSLMGVLAALCAYGAWWYYDYSSVHYAYYKDYAEVDNLPVGIAPMSGKQAGRHSHYYRFLIQYRRLQRVDCLDAQGNIIQPPAYPGHETRPATILVDANKNEKSNQSQRYIYTDGRDSKELRFEKNSVEFYGSSTDLSGKPIIRTRGMDDNANKSVKCIRFTRTAHARGSWVSSETFYNEYNQKVLNDAGVARRAYERDGSGRITTVTNYDDTGNMRMGEHGYARAELSYDKNGDLANIRLFDSDGRQLPPPKP